MTKPSIKEEIEIPAGVQVSLANAEIKIKGPKGEYTKNFHDPKIKLTIESNTVVVSGLMNNKKAKRMIGTISAHIRNLIKGCIEPYQYSLKVCSGHFPMTVAVSGETLSVKNFFGEKIARTTKIKKGVTVKVEGDIINIEGVNKETCGQVAADIEHLTKRASFDKRIFQDGIYITKKEGKDIR